MGFGVKPITNLQEKTKQFTVDESQVLQITREDLINLFIAYNIPVARETVNAIKQHPVFFIKK